MKKVKASGRSESDTPRNAPQVPCNCGREDEREEQKGTKREPKRLNDTARGLDVAHQGAEGYRPIHKNNKPKAYACVLHWDGTPLTPTKIGKAKAMVRGGRATVVRHNPFTVRLTNETTKHAPEMTLGIDAGYSHVGYAIVSEETGREYFRGTLEQESGKTGNPASERLTERAMYRRQRRSRLWHREARFDNRRNMAGKYAPSIERKYLTHLNLWRMWAKMVPITETIVEAGKFDIQAAMAPDIQGVGYQQGPMLGYVNTKAYVMAREKGVCQLCGGPVAGQKVNLHHIRLRSRGGSDRADNMALLHEECHKRLHREGLEKRLTKPKKFVGETFMSSVWMRFPNDIPHCRLTFGCLTAYLRQENGIEKSHADDAFVIAGGAKTFTRCGEEWVVAQHRRNDRQLQWNQIRRKGSGGRRIRRGRKPYHSGDLVWVDGEMKVCKGMTGDRVVLEFKKTPAGNNCPVTVSVKKITKHYRNNYEWRLQD